MRTARREVSCEVQRKAVGLLEGSGRARMQAGAELGLQPSRLRIWRAIRDGVPPRLQGGPPASATGLGAALPADLASKNAKLRRGLERTRMERDGPRKAIGIVAQAPR